MAKVASVTKHYFFSPGILSKPKSKFHLWDKINKKSPKIHFGLFCYLLEFNLRWSFHANQYSISLNIIRCLQCQGHTEAEFVLQYYLFSQFVQIDRNQVIEQFSTGYIFKCPSGTSIIVNTVELFLRVSFSIYISQKSLRSLA